MELPAFLNLTGAVRRVLLTGLSQLVDCLLVAQSRSNGHELTLIFDGVEDLVFEHHSPAQIHFEMDDSPLVVTHFSLLKEDPAALIEPAQDSPPEVHVLQKMSFQPRHALLRGVDPKLTF